MNKVFKYTAVSGLVLTALYAGFGHFVAPTLIKSTLSNLLGGQLNRDVTIENVSVNPWTLEVELNKLQVAGRNNHAPLLLLDRFYVNASAQSIIEFAPVLDEITVDGIHACVALDDEDIAKLINSNSSNNDGTATEKKSGDSASSDGSLPKFALYNVSVKNSSLQVIDRARAIDQSITEFNLELPFVSTLPTSKNSLVTPALSMKLNDTPIIATGSTKPFGSTLSANLNTRISNLDLAPLFRLVPAVNTPALTLEKGKLSTELNLVFRNATGGKPGKMLLSGTVNLSDIAATQQANGRVHPLASFKKATVRLTELDFLEHHAKIQNVVLQDPKLNAVMSDAGLNFSQIGAAPAEPSSTKAQPAAKSVTQPATKPVAQAEPSSAWLWQVDNVQIRNGSANWTDSTVKPTAKLAAANFNATVTGLTNANGAAPAKAEVGVKALGGTLSLTADVVPMPLAFTANAKGNQLQTSQLAAYIKSATGFDIASIVNFDVNGAMKGTELTGNGTASVQNLQVRQGKTTLASAKTASVTLKSLDLSKQSVVVEKALLDGAVVNAVLNPKGLNLTQTATTQPEPTTAPAQSASQTPAWSWKVVSAQVKDSKLNFKDNTVKPAATITVTDINAGLKNLASAKNSKGEMNVSATLFKGTAALNGTIGLEPLNADLTTKLANIDMKSLSPVMTSYAGIGAASGTLQTNGRLGLTTEKEKQIISWTGDVDMAKFNMLNAKKRSLMTWNDASLKGLDVKTTKPIYLHVAQAEIDQPGTKETTVVRNVSNIAGTLAALAGKDKTAQKLGKVDKYLGSKIVINNIRYENGKFSASDLDGNAVASTILNKLSKEMASKLK